MYILRRGLGILDYNDLIAQANLQSCDPHDIACVADNVAKQAAVEDFWAAHQSTGVQEGTQLNFAPLTSGQVSAFATPGSPNVGNVVPTGIMYVSQPDLPAAPAPAVQSPPTPPMSPVTDCTTILTLQQNGIPAPTDPTSLARWNYCVSGPGRWINLVTNKPNPKTPSAATPPAATPTPTPTQSNVPTNFTSTFTMPDFSQGFSFSAVPWWMWAGGGLAALWFFGGKRR